MNLKQTIKSKNTKTLTKNFSALAILQMLRYLIPLIVLPYVTPIIGLEHFGEIAIANSFVLIGQLLVNYSFGFMGARDVARFRDNKEKVSEIVSITIFSYVFLYIIMLAIAIGIIVLVPKFRSIWLLIAISLAWPLFSALVCEWFFQGMEQMQTITIVNVISRTVCCALIFIFIKKKEDYLLYPLFNTIAFLIATLYSIIVMVFKFKCRITTPSFKAMFAYIKRGKDLFLNQICVTLLNKMPNILLGTICGSASAGLYDAAFRLQDAGYHGVDTLNRTFFPFLARRMDKHKAYRRINFAFALVISIFLFAFAPLLVRLLYAAEFAPAVKLLRILAISVLFLGISSAYGVNHLLLIGKEKLVRNITFCVTGCGVLLLVAMIHWFDEMGAAFTMVIVNATFALSYFVTAKRIERKGENCLIINSKA